MAQDWAKQFYNSKAWYRARNNYVKKIGGLCERCLQQGRISPCEIVHHKIHLNPRNINNVSISLNEDNLQGVCRECHALIHKGRGERRYLFDRNGNIIV